MALFLTLSDLMLVMIGAQNATRIVFLIVKTQRRAKITPAQQVKTSFTVVITEH